MNGCGTTPTDLRLSSFAAPIRALVVGASGGIGSEIVAALAESSSVERVFGTSRRAIDQRLRALVDASAGKVSVHFMDLTRESEIRAAVAELSAQGPLIDLVINCAGLLHDGGNLGPERKLDHVEPANLERLFRVHAVGPLLLAKCLQPMFPRKGRVVFASLSARVGSIGDNRAGGWYAYRMSKAAHNMAIKNLSIELRRRAAGMICVSLHPGTVESELSRPFISRVAKEKLFSPRRAARQLLEVIDSLGPDHNGGFYAWDKSKIPW
jgi:NAD(P)-dependent dehydrogenase (short-subunit alcohol dehydrogenase family)